MLLLTFALHCVRLNVCLIGNKFLFLAINTLQEFIDFVVGGSFNFSQTWNMISLKQTPPNFWDTLLVNQPLRICNMFKGLTALNLEEPSKWRLLNFWNTNRQHFNNSYMSAEYQKLVRPLFITVVNFLFFVVVITGSFFKRFPLIHCKAGCTVHYLRVQIWCRKYVSKRYKQCYSLKERKK